MLLEKDKLKQAYEQRGIRAAQDPVFAKVAINVEAKLVHNVLSEASAGRDQSFKFYADERGEAGGSGKGPLPLEYFLAGLAFCYQSIMARTAASLGIDLNAVSSSVKGILDRRGAYGTADVDSAFQRIIFTVNIQSSESQDRIRELIELVDKRCPAHETLRKACSIAQKVTLNGVEVNTQSVGSTVE